MPWPTRARFETGTSRGQRKKQLEAQMNVIYVVIGLTLVISFFVIYANWQNAGGAKRVSCESYPDFCVPLAGGSADFARLEAEGARTLDGTPDAADGVVRYIDTNGIPTIGNPNAPIHLVVVSDFACPHCQDFHKDTMDKYIEEYVLSGQGTFGLVMVTGTGGVYSETASQAALCAGEQGGFWEMSAEFFRLAEGRQIADSFSYGNIEELAKDMGMNSSGLIECLTSNKYDRLMTAYQQFSQDGGVSGTPTVLASAGNTNQWSKVARDWGTLQQITEEANQRQE
jgi:protein-disulfide isomerase